MGIRNKKLRAGSLVRKYTLNQLLSQRDKELGN